MPAAAASLTPVDADGDGNIDLVFVVCGGSGGRCAVVILFNSLPAVCGGSDDDCRRVCSVDAFDDGSFTAPPVPLPPGDVVTQHYSVKWLPASAAAGGSGRRRQNGGGRQLVVGESDRAAGFMAG